MKLHVVMYDNHITGKRKWHIRNESDQTVAVVDIAFEQLANGAASFWNLNRLEPTPEEVGLPDAL